jgi:hypothetical protein
MTLTSLGRFRFAMMPVTNLALSLQGRGLTWFREARFREREMKRAGNSLTIQLREKLILCLGEFHGCGAFFVVVSHRIDSSAYRIAPRQPSIVRSQQFGRRTHIPHPRIEP